VTSLVNARLFYLLVLLCLVASVLGQLQPGLGFFDGPKG
jgi:hypothetical protein